MNLMAKYKVKVTQGQGPGHTSQGRLNIEKHRKSSSLTRF